jgi:hypothetical protein
MISIQSLVAKKIASSPLIANMLSKNLLNTNQFAREIQDEIQASLTRKVTLNAIVVAVSRCKEMIKAPEKIKVKKISIAYPVYWNFFNFQDNHELIDFLGEQSVSKDDLFSFKNNKLIVISKKQKKLENPGSQIVTETLANFCEIKIECSFEQYKIAGILHIIASCLYWANISVIDINIIKEKLYLYVENNNVSFVLDTLRKCLIEDSEL